MWEVRLEKAKAAAWRMGTFSMFTCHKFGFYSKGCEKVLKNLNQASGMLRFVF